MSRPATPRHRNLPPAIPSREQLLPDLLCQAAPPWQGQGTNHNKHHQRLGSEGPGKLFLGVQLCRKLSGPAMVVDRNCRFASLQGLRCSARAGVNAELSIATRQHFKLQADWDCCFELARATPGKYTAVALQNDRVLKSPLSLSLFQYAITLIEASPKRDMLKPMSNREQNDDFAICLWESLRKRLVPRLHAQVLQSLSELLNGLHSNLGHAAGPF